MPSTIRQIACSLGIVALALSLKGGGTMNLGARTAMWSGGTKPWVNPYPTDGLMLYVDGEWSGVNPVNLATGEQLTPFGTITQGDKFLGLDDSYIYGELQEIHDIIANGDFTLDMLAYIKVTEASNAGVIAIGRGGGPRGLWLWSGNNGGMLNGISYCDNWNGVAFPSVYPPRLIRIRMTAKDKLLTAFVGDIKVTRTNQGATFDNSFYIGKLGMSYAMYKMDLYRCLFYNRALTDDEASVIYETDKARFGLT